jgi:glycosyltransferase involved in cell wall biosynthesis
MKIWHLISNRWNSAISEYALSAAKATRDLGHQVLMTPLSEGPVEGRFKEAKFEVSSVDHFGPARFGKLSSIAGKFIPDVIFVYGGPETTAALFLKGQARLIRFHGYRSADGGLIQAVARRLGHFHVDTVMAPSNYVADGLREVFSTAVDIVTLGCETEIFNFKDVQREVRPELLIFGRLDPVKGHREFLPIFKHLLNMAEAQNHVRPKLRVVGLPANLSVRHILESAKVLNIGAEDIGIQCERVANVAEFMSRVALGVVPSLGSEVICRVAEEFLLCGTPVITSDVGSLPELFIHPSFGAYYGNSEGQKIAEMIYPILTDSHAESLSARRARGEEAKKHFSLSSMRQGLKEILERP